VALTKNGIGALSSGRVGKSRNDNACSRFVVASYVFLWVKVFARRCSFANLNVLSPQSELNVERGEGEAIDSQIARQVKL